ncbi:hypothetical protein SAMN04488134_10512 [Amphibacillus marinus]|uniref:Uncharacterized protein n=1 Tax=Amphibacillus marinus TaxID=872970 RepID=A0A1H8MVG1_9BACI|nr:hypothetical protein [Amphibacillus marinus]SEO21203.1 hypothetical protein SAMN04488134_10512 [Amphibacillus marinus]
MESIITNLFKLIKKSVNLIAFEESVRTPVRSSVYLDESCHCETKQAEGWTVERSDDRAMQYLRLASFSVLTPLCMMRKVNQGIRLMNGLALRNISEEAPMWN